jgi:hypothetical protein
MKNGSSLKGMPCLGIEKSAYNQLRLQVLTGGLTQYLSAEDILDGTQIQPALITFQIGNITAYGLMRFAEGLPSHKVVKPFSTGFSAIGETASLMPVIY